MSEVMTEPVEVEAEVVKNKGGRPRKYPVEPPTIKNEDGRKINGWLVSEGFSRIMLFPDPFEGTKSYPVSLTVGDHKRVTIYKNVMHVLPNAIVNAILDTVNEYPVDDTTDIANPVRTYEKKTQLPHSSPIPATEDDYRAYLVEMKTRRTAADFIRNKGR